MTFRYKSITKRQVVILLGPPGAGKSTQVEIVAKHFGYTPISIGRSLRRQAKTGSQLGKRIKQITSQGLNVPPEMIFQAIESDLTVADNGIIIDNPFRNLDQLKAWNKYFAFQHLEVVKVFHLVISEDLSYQRQLNQAHRLSGEVRNDTDPVVMSQRFQKGYSASIADLLKFWQDRDLLTELDGTEPIEKVTIDIVKTLEAN